MATKKGDITEKAFDRVEKYSTPEYTLPVIILGLIFFATIWILAFLKHDTTSQIITLINEKLIFLILFAIGILFLTSLAELLFKKKAIEVEDTGMMSGFAYKDANDSKYKRWILVAMISVFHAMFFIIFNG